MREQPGVGAGVDAEAAFRSFARGSDLACNAKPTPIGLFPHHNCLLLRMHRPQLVVAVGAFVVI
jgi:hypothetical protein